MERQNELLPKSIFQMSQGQTCKQLVIVSTEKNPIISLTSKVQEFFEKWHQILAQVLERNEDMKFLNLFECKDDLYSLEPYFEELNHAIDFISIDENVECLRDNFNSDYNELINEIYNSHVHI